MEEKQENKPKRTPYFRKIDFDEMSINLSKCVKRAFISRDFKEKVSQDYQIFRINLNRIIERAIEINDPLICLYLLNLGLIYGVDKQTLEQWYDEYQKKQNKNKN